MKQRPECGLIVSSVTYAVYGRDALVRRGIKAFIQRLDPSAAGGCGCGYGLRAGCECDEAERILAEEKITVKGYYEPI